MKLDRAIEALKKDMAEIDEVMDVISIERNNADGIVIHVKSLRDMEQIPDIMAFKRTSVSDTHWPMQATKVYAGAKFFCLLTYEEYQEAV